MSTYDTRTVWIVVLSALAGSHATTVGKLANSFRENADERFVIQGGLVALGIGIFLGAALSYGVRLRSRPNAGSADIRAGVAVAMLAGVLDVVDASVGTSRMELPEAVGAVAILFLVLASYCLLPWLISASSSSRLFGEYFTRLSIAVVIAAALGGIIRLASGLAGGTQDFFKSDPMNAAVFALWTMLALAPFFSGTSSRKHLAWLLFLCALPLSCGYQFLAFKDSSPRQAATNSGARQFSSRCSSWCRR